jgi:hypothetical protein
LSRNTQIGIAVAAVLLAAVFVVGATQAPGTVMSSVSADVAADAQVSDAPMGCHGDAKAYCHGAEECPGPDSEDCEGHDGDCEQNCHGDDGDGSRDHHRRGRGGCHG